MSNRFPADDEHLHPYPGNLKHHKVENMNTLEDYLMSPEHRQLMANHLEAQKGFFDKAVKAATASYELQNGWLREALLKLVELEDRTLEGMSSCAPSSEEWLKAFNEARYVIDITRP
jgi:hypothetical protein